MSFEKIKLTNKGRQLLAKATAGKQLVFTRIKMGDGQITSQVVERMDDVISEVISLRLNTPIVGEGYTSITGNFRNAATTDQFTGDGTTKTFKLSATPQAVTKVMVGDTETKSYVYSSGEITLEEAPSAGIRIEAIYNLEGFYFREIALFARDPDDNTEIMYAYQNAYNLAEYIASASSETVEKIVGVGLVVSSSIEINVEMSESLMLMPLSQGQYKTEILAEANDVGSDTLIPIYQNGKNESTSLRKIMSAITTGMPYEGEEKAISSGGAYTALEGKENKAEYVELIMEASKWDQTTSTYNFEDTWPAAAYDIEIGPSNDATAEQIQAYGAALIPINSSSNTAIAKGEIPEIDIPLVVKVVAK